MFRRMMLSAALLVSTWAVAHPTVAAAADRDDDHNGRNGYVYSYRNTREEHERAERIARERRERERREHDRYHAAYDNWRR